MNGMAMKVAGGDGGGNEIALDQSVSLPLIKRLASCDKSCRDQALKKVLRAWLPSQQPEQVSDDELKKLWKGLFYCVWHSDKAPVQLELINRLSALIVSLPVELSLRYFSMFLVTMRREWTGIDRLRLDKFYLLIRRFVNACFRMLQEKYWDLEISRRFMSVLERDTFCSKEYLLGNGVNYHIASVFLDELKQFLPLRIETLDVIFKPFILAMTVSHDKLLVTKIASNVFNVLLKFGKSLIVRKRLGDGASSDARDDVFLHGTVALKLNFSSKFYDSGSSADCFQGNRKVLFGLHDGFMKLEKDLTSFGIEIPNPDILVNEEDSIPKLISIMSAGEANENGQIVAITEHSKKKKRKSQKALDTDNKERKKNKKKNIETSETKEDDGIEIPNPEFLVNEEDPIPKLISIMSAGEENEKGKIVAITELSKKKRKSQEALDTDSKKRKKNNKKKKIETPETKEDDGDTSLVAKPDNISTNSNPKIQFEDSQETGTLKTPGSDKRKKRKNKDLQESNGKEENDDANLKSGEKSAKKVSFSMKNNMIWKPHCPLPPQDLRIPPTLAPRGSALKKGVPPGPVVEKRKANQVKKRINGPRRF